MLDTDSLFINIYQLLIDQGVAEIFDSLDEDTQIDYIQRIAGSIQDYVNEKSFEITQLQDYASQEFDHKISFKSEKVCKSGLWVRKKKYMIWCVFEDGYKPKDNLQVTGLETVRSDTPSIVKPMIKDVMAKILNSNNKNDLVKDIQNYERQLKSTDPAEIAENIAVHDLGKYIDRDFNCKKGTPRHTRGVAALKMLVKNYNLESKVDNIGDGDKVKIVYLKKNRFGFDSISFLRWLPEFTDIGLEIDYDKMIYKNFTKKIEPLLNAANIMITSSTNDDVLGEWLAWD